MEKINKYNYRQFAGYCLDDKRFHVCGYEDNKILIQATRDGNYKQVKKMIYNSSKGLYFNYKNKRIYIIAG